MSSLFESVAIDIFGGLLELSSQYYHMFLWLQCHKNTGNNNNSGKQCHNTNLTVGDFKLLTIPLQEASALAQPVISMGFIP